MGKVEEVLKSEVIRLTKKQLRAEVAPLARDVRELKRSVSRLKKRSNRSSALCPGKNVRGNKTWVSFELAKTR